MHYVVYILADKPNGTIYIGSTSNLTKRLDQHRSKVMSKSFTAKYSVTNLVYVEYHDSAESMVNRERNMKAWKRNWKIRLIIYENPKWRDLASEIY